MIVVIGLLVLVMNYRYAEKANKPSELGTQTRTAFLRWREQIQGLERGEDIYKLYNYPNPPIQALILFPLTKLPPIVGGLTWLNLKVLMAGAALVWAFRIVTDLGRTFPPYEMPITVIFSLHPILGDLSHGNVNIFIAFLLIGSLEAYRRGWDLTTGLALALAIACKVTPALFVPYFGWKWVWNIVSEARAGRSPVAAACGPAGKVLAGCVVGLGLWLFVVPGAVLGWERNTTLLTSWYEGMVHPFLVEGKVTSEEASQSIPGVVFRLLTHEPSKKEFDLKDGRVKSEEFHNFVDIGHDAAHWVIRGCQVLFVLGVVGLCRAPTGPTAPRQGVRLSAEFAYVILGMLLFSERTWKHHGVTLIVVYASLAAFWLFRPSSIAMRVYIGATYSAVAALILAPSFFGGHTQDVMMTYGSHTCVFLLLTTAVCVVMWYENRAGGRPVVE
ncbi:hypothetical protein FRUB_08899 [Fimbriiglobus ruber]|uniref:DUF2029 domain-containing protein n=1 Tax=Fimbriiglobus ruber TaxID=1908690 RepID=A0A225DG53_9BACT|nr:hypothetical protein FRUB_08899 [Fimbriiglobus ruber]